MSVGVHFLMESVPEGYLVGIDSVAVGMEGLGRHMRRVERYSEVDTEALMCEILLEAVSNDRS